MTLYELNDADADEAFEAIASRRYWARCECEPDVGYTCKRCKESTRRMARDNDEGSAEERRANDAIERYAERLKRKAVR